LGLGDESFPCFIGLGCLGSATSERRDLMIWEASLGWPRGFLLSLGLGFWARSIGHEKTLESWLTWFGEATRNRPPPHRALNGEPERSGFGL